MSAPISGQIPRAIDSDAAVSQMPVGHPAMAGTGKFMDRAYPSAIFD
jgi:hypothetical protein